MFLFPISDSSNAIFPGDVFLLFVSRFPESNSLRLLSLPSFCCFFPISWNFPSPSDCFCFRLLLYSLRKCPAAENRHWLAIELLFVVEEICRYLFVAVARDWKIRLNMLLWILADFFPPSPGRWWTWTSCKEARKLGVRVLVCKRKYSRGPIGEAGFAKYTTGRVEVAYKS